MTDDDARRVARVMVDALVDALKARSDSTPAATPPPRPMAGYEGRGLLLGGSKTVYFVRQGSDGPIKIGFTGNLDSRLTDLRTANPYPLQLLGRVPGDEDTERSIHAHFAHLRIHGEWFTPAPELLSFIAREAQ